MIVALPELSKASSVPLGIILADVATVVTPLQEAPGAMPADWTKKFTLSVAPQQVSAFLNGSKAIKGEKESIDVLDMFTGADQVIAA